jgi:uncharacterized protein (DUF2236 family)
MADLFPESSVIRRVNLEPAIMFGAGRALLLQIAHPAVAQGVEHHSDFKRNPFKRLQGTVEAMYTAVFGPAQLARDVGRRIHWIHEHVVGPDYRANDPANLMWVHATLLDTALRCYTELVEPLSDADAQAYYEEMTKVAELFGLAREDQPADLDAFCTYFDDAVANMAVTETGRELAAFIVAPILPGGLHMPLRPGLALFRLFSLGMLPPPVREQLGFGWTEEDEHRYQRAHRVVARIMARTPRAVRTAPNRLSEPLILAQARRHVAAFAAEHPEVMRPEGSAAA